VGVLSKILNRNQSTENKKISLPENSTPENSPGNSREEKKSTRPTEPCPNQHPGPTPPYGLHHWLDSYGQWHCTQCEPPATLGMVRDEMLIDLSGRNGDGKNASTGTLDTKDNSSEREAEVKQWNPSPGFRIISIRHPDGTREFSPTSTQAERAAAVESDEWFDRIDSRLEKQRQSQSA
jgi:hypothetical protein